MNAVLQKGIYKHYKGNEYEVLAIALHTETLEQMVVYRLLAGEPQVWIRPLDMFLEHVEIDGITKKRFEFVGFTKSELDVAKF